MYIIQPPGLASYRWSRLNSNVRPHTNPPHSTCASKASSPPGTKSAALATSSRRKEVSQSLYVSQPGHEVQAGHNSTKLCRSKSKLDRKVREQGTFSSSSLAGLRGSLSEPVARNGVPQLYSPSQRSWSSTRSSLSCGEPRSGWRVCTSLRA